MITDNYIKMCEQAKEIQKWWFPDICDLYYDKLEMETKPITFLAEKIWLSERSRGCNFIWLPIQEQLQEMIDSKPYNLFYIFRHWYESSANIYKGITWNELWFAFVMHEKYNKVWTGEKWEEVKE